jgi:hypothetical protein
MSIVSRLRQVFSLTLPPVTLRQLLVESAFLGFFIAVFILIFQPFGTYEFQIPYKTQRLLGYGLVVFVSYLLIKLGLSSLFRQGGYTFGKELLVIGLTFFLVASVCFLYFKKVAYPGATWNDYNDFLIFCFAIGFLPLMVIVYSRYTLGLRFFREASRSLETVKKEKTLELTGANQDESYLFREADIVYLQSSGNYVEVHFIKEGTLKSVLLRSTLSQMMAQVPVQSFRVVHRSYVVNQRHFSHFEKAAGKGTLSSEKWSVEVPVSRTNLAVAEQIARDFR